MRMRPVRLREPCQIGPLAVVAAAATALLVVLAVGGGGHAARAAPPTSQTPAEAWNGFVGGERVQVGFGERQIVVLRAPSLAQRVAAAGGIVDDVQERQWTQAVLAQQREVIQKLVLQGVVIHPDFTFARVLNGFSAALDARASALLERMPEVKGLYPVRAVYPAAISTSGLDQLTSSSGGLSQLSLPGLTGRGVTIALLDTGVDRVQPLLAGHVRQGYDLVDGDALALAEARPGNPADIEHHGTELAGLVLGHGDGVGGVAPGATILPLRVAGWQRDASGNWAVYGRTDQLIAGLERAVDPNGDGDAHDAARIALAGVVEPFAAFADGPAADAVTGADALDTLVVVPAGNDGPAGPAYGSISGPGGAPDALTVGAADLRPDVARVPVMVRAGLRVLFEGSLPLVGTMGPPHAVTLRLEPAGRRRSGREGPFTGPPRIADFFAGGTSTVAGRAAFMATSTAPGVAVQNAATAGAVAVVFYGDSIPSGALGLPDNVSVPVIALPRAVARQVRDASARGVPLSVSIGHADLSAQAPQGRIADFSSRGLAYDGRVKPDLVGPGVGLPTSEPGTNEDGTPHLGTVNGSSAAAAALAGAAALLAQARPSLDAGSLKALLVGSARRLPGDSPTEQGAGFVDLGAAAASELAITPSAVVFDPLHGRATSTETLQVKNVSVRPIAARVFVGGPAHVGVSASPRRVRLRPGAAANVRLVARLRQPGASGEAIGTIRVAPETGVVERTLWSAEVGDSRRQLLSAVVLNVGGGRPNRESPPAFKPSDSAPAVVSLQAGSVFESGGVLGLQPVSRLDLRLGTASGEDLGLLTRLRDLLPGRYAFGLTGRGPGGNVLPKGTYKLRIAAYPTVPGAPTRRTLRFRIR